MLGKLRARRKLPVRQSTAEEIPSQPIYSNPRLMTG